MTAKIYTSLNERLARVPSDDLTSGERDMLERAKGLALASDCAPHKLGAIIFRKGRILGRGYNKRKSHPMQARYNQYSINLHAEIAAVVDALRENPDDLHGSSIAVARVSRKGIPCCSYPCIACAAALAHVGVRRIVCYDASDLATSIAA